ncbi:DUF6397 family protein [Streptomyces sp. SBT349]|uniref:DUF6397 family protein n=1 Tax=Streptomyces sp. SBT349 TaxID=1580539 RepID=UPI00066AE5CD|nr:DUF6397 family protein [Streptomyces sp. SBT349]
MHAYQTSIITAPREEWSPGPDVEPSPLVNATAGAQLLGIAPARFARLARYGCFSPVDLRVNRHRVLVWRYPAAELRAFAASFPTLLSGPVPDPMRRSLARGDDWRPRRWRGRRTTLLAGRAETVWQRAAAHAAVLEPPALEAEAPDPGERDLLRRLRPRLIGPTLAAQHGDTVRPLLTATDPDEVRGYRTRLRHALREARGGRAEPPLRAGPRP